MKRFIFGFSVLSIAIIGFSLAETRSFASKLKDIQFKGYITEVNSPTSFRVDDYRITVENERDIELENVEKKAVKFNPTEQIKVGTFIKVKGKYDPDTLETTVTEVKIDMKQFRNLSATVVLDATPQEIQKLPSGKWNGVILADARRIVINEKTDVRFKLNKSEEKAEKEERKKAEKEAKEQAESNTEKRETERETEATDPARDDFDDDDDLNDLMKDSRPLQELSQIGPGVYMTYNGKEDASGSIATETVVFVRNEKTKQEKDEWKKARVKEKDAKDASSFAKMKVGGKEYKVLREDQIQDYITRLGQSLIPEYQKRLPVDDDNKIPFRFTVVYDKGLGAGSYATGTVVINHELFNQLENEAQLVFILSHEIAHATQEHTIREINHNRKKRKGLFIARVVTAGMGYSNVANVLKYTELAMVQGYNRSTENQADRMGLSNMILHGYDPREAPRTWKLFSLLEGDQPKTFLSSHDSHTERRSYLWLTIHNTYAGLDLGNMKRDSDEFHRVAEMVKQKYPSKLKRRDKTL